MNNNKEQAREAAELEESIQCAAKCIHGDRPAVERIPGEHEMRLFATAHVIRGLIAEALTQATSLKDAEIAKANTPFEDANPRISIEKVDGYYEFRIDGGSVTGPFTTWREAYRAADGAIEVAAKDAEIERLKDERTTAVRMLGEKQNELTQKDARIRELEEVLRTEIENLADMESYNDPDRYALDYLKQRCGRVKGRLNNSLSTSRGESSEQKGNK